MRILRPFLEGQMTAHASGKQLRLGIMGGTFDPIHWAHLVMADEAGHRFNLDKVLFVTAGEPPHKPGAVCSHAEHRHAMVILATASNPLFEASRIELDRQGPSYSVDTIREVKSLYGDHASIYFIIGADEARDIQSWHEADALPGLARFIVAPRPGFDIAELRTILPERFCNAMDFLPMPPIDISATDLRARVASRRSIRYLVPETVEAYILKHGLYIESGRQ